MAGGFKGFSLGPSSGQSFRRFGAKSKDFALAIEDLEALSLRFRVIGKESANEAIEIMRDCIVRHIERGSGNFHGYSTGRLAATIGWWDESQFSSAEMAAFAKEQAMDWAENNGVGGERVETNDELTVIEYGAYASAKRFRGDIWAVEVGTFTPYAGLVEDGGSMPIAMYGKANVVHIATWEANHMFKKGMFDAEVELEAVIDRKVKMMLD